MKTTRSLLVLGGARSGKSSYAQRLAESSGLDLVLIATAEPSDPEMSDRIARHRADRRDNWTTVEEPIAVCEVLRETSAKGRIVVVDCLTLWLSKLVLSGGDPGPAAATLADSLMNLAGPVILVSNEVGSGIVPDNAMAREFRDHQGRLNQTMARTCDRVVLVTAGCAVQIKPAATPDVQF